ncbi:MAG: DUF2971 domain-containing protein [Syntrophobacteraceae bacterium]
MMHEEYINIERNEYATAIYRFTDVKWLLDSIVGKRNTLLSPRIWEDPFENALANQFRHLRSTALYHFRNRVYGQCWTFQPETDAFWRAYLPQGDGVRLKSTVHKLYRSLETEISRTTLSHMSCCIGRVHYKQEDEIISLFHDKEWVQNVFLNQGTLGHVKSLLLKRMEFEYESEVRLLYLDPHNIDHGNLFSYDIDPFSTILEVTFDPRMEDTLYHTYESILKSFGFTGEINKSRLYTAPKITISA